MFNTHNTLLNNIIFYFLFIPGMGEVHDGVNFMRAACVIAIEKAQMSFEPMLEVRMFILMRVILVF